MRFSLALTSFAVLMTALGQPAGAVMPQKGEPSVSVPRMNMQDYPSTGPWLVEVESGQHENVIYAAQTKRSTDPKYRTKEAQDVPFKTHRTMTNLKGYNLVVVEGIHQEDLHKIQGVKAVNPNTIRTKAYAWGYDRIDQVNAPPDQAAWNADYEGCGGMGDNDMPLLLLMIIILTFFIVLCFLQYYFHSRCVCTRYGYRHKSSRISGHW